MNSLNEFLAFFAGAMVTTLLIVLMVVFIAANKKENVPEPNIIEVIIYDCSEQNQIELLKTE